MKIFLSRNSKGIGGGWSFVSNFIKAMGDKITDDYNEADIFFIAGASMVSKEEVEQAKKDGKKVVLRIDNILRNSRNRNTGMSRMKSYAQAADLVIFQSRYALEILGQQYLQVEGPVILNGCDTSIFNTDGREESETARYLYSRVNRDETKNFEMARFIYQQESYFSDSPTVLNLVGEYSSELQEYNFDFYNGEEFKYWGVVRDPHAMAAIYKMSDYLIYTFWNDACSNTLIEALCSGCQILDPYGMCDTGGAVDIMHAFSFHGGEKDFTLERMAEDYTEEMARL